ncbi:MAG: efflux RND transporter periplasmic adaptor subunit [Alphaproteobacteria bacterium]|nr:efflux RND transporter periplasmic adaptor subunit [Alphaproteobacteria bacterium]
MRYAILLTLIAVVRLVAQADAAEYVVEPRMVDDRKAVFGTVESVHETQARARIAGTLADVSVVEGDQVGAGQRVALVQDPKLPLRLAETDSRLKALDAQHAQAQADFGRMAKLRKTHAVSQAQYDQARTALDVTNSQIAAMQSARNLILEQQAEGAVLAPVAGRILKVKKIAGAVIMPGEVVATLAEQTYVLRIKLPERHARFLKVGDLVQVEEPGASAAAADPRDGRIRLIYPKLDRGRIVADVDVAGLGDYFVGERVRAYVPTGQRETYMVPANFVFRRFGVYFVSVKAAGEVPVQVGNETPQGVEVLSGIHTGDVLVAP